MWLKSQLALIRMYTENNFDTNIKKFYQAIIFSIDRTTTIIAWKINLSRNHFDSRNPQVIKSNWLLFLARKTLSFRPFLPSQKFTKTLFTWQAREINKLHGKPNLNPWFQLPNPFQSCSQVKNNEILYFSYIFIKYKYTFVWVLACLCGCLRLCLCEPATTTQVYKRHSPVPVSAPSSFPWLSLFLQPFAIECFLAKCEIDWKTISNF